MSPYRTVNPATGKVEREFPLHDEQTAFAKLTAAHSLWQTDWSRRSFAERRAIIARAAESLERDKENYARLISLEMGKVKACLLYTSPSPRDS